MSKARTFRLGKLAGAVAVSLPMLAVSAGATAAITGNIGVVSDYSNDLASTAVLGIGYGF